MTSILVPLVFISSILVFAVILTALYWRRLNLEYRLFKIDEAYSDHIELDERKSLPFKSRVLEPIRSKIMNIIMRVTPKGALAETDKQLKAAGHPFGLTPEGWLIFKISLYIMSPLFAILYSSILPISSGIKFMIIAIFTIIGIIFPNAVIKERIKLRQKKMIQQLPDILDMLTISVEAGLSFEGALQRVTKKDKSELSQEFAKVLQEMQFGKSRREALLEMVKRNDVGDIKIFISSMIQAEQLGVSIGKVLRIQSSQLRVKRRQRAQEQAMKAPIKMLFPLIFFIFPSIFIVLLGPAVIQIMKVF